MALGCSTAKDGGGRLRPSLLPFLLSPAPGAFPTAGIKASLPAPGGGCTLGLSAGSSPGRLLGAKLPPGAGDSSLAWTGPRIPSVRRSWECWKGSGPARRGGGAAGAAGTGHLHGALQALYTTLQRDSKHSKATAIPRFSSRAPSLPPPPHSNPVQPFPKGNALLLSHSHWEARLKRPSQQESMRDTPGRAHPTGPVGCHPAGGAERAPLGFNSAYGGYRGCPACAPPH